MKLLPSLQRIVNIFMMALTVWREARGQSVEARTAVAFVLKDRAAEGGWWARDGDDILSVAATKRQFSSLTAPDDPQLTTWPRDDEPVWIECLGLAQQVEYGVIANPAPGADSYYDVSIPAPRWASTGTFLRQIGNIRFYRVRGQA